MHQVFLIFKVCFYHILQHLWFYQFCAVEISLILIRIWTQFANLDQVLPTVYQSLIFFYLKRIFKRHMVNLKQVLVKHIFRITKLQFSYKSIV